MKDTTHNPQDNSKSSDTSQSPEDQPQSQKILGQYQIEIQELEKTLKTIKKIKLIRKDGLNHLKKKNKTMKNIFIHMSDFFVTKRNKNQMKDKKTKQFQQKLKRRELRNKAFLKNEAVRLSKLKQIQAAQAPQESQPSEPLEEINVRSSHCYICSKQYIKIDEIYHQHCPECASFSKTKRFQSTNLSGMVAMVTGARIKIGYEIVLKLLRDGAKVYATTRFTHDALIRYKREADYQKWKDNLFLLQCDFMSSKQVQQLIEYIRDNVERLDILINNAAQTLTRPKQFFTYQLQNQTKEAEDPDRIVLEKKIFQNMQFPSLQAQNQFSIEKDKSQKAIDLQKFDQFGQPLDLRAKNTWREKIEDVSLFDCMSTQIVNSIVPFHLISSLKHLMGGEKISWIINVSSMEGVFYRVGKSFYHPHTNMAKAALNMITRTSSQDLKRLNIYMNSVDTGWVTNENPLFLANKHEVVHDFTPPLDCIEGAMRVLDPIYLGVVKNQYPFGKFLKDYRESSW